MIYLMKTVAKCLTSPRLHKIYRDGEMHEMYQAQRYEKWGNTFISLARTIMNITLYTSPLIYLYVYKRGLWTIEECNILGLYFCGVSSVIGLAFLVRAYGRATNPIYIEFVNQLKDAPDKTSEAYVEAMRGYDFDFTSWPISYSMPQKISSSWLSFNPFQTKANADLLVFIRLPVQLLAFVATHTFALRLIYPGSLGLLYSFLWTPLFLGRTYWVEANNGKRAKVKTADGNYIDTMFVDKRNQSPNGSTLIICCEGNSGFYEMGIMSAPIEAKYSALGWNHPGFAESTGLPYPSQEQNAIDAVLQYAINKLCFKPEDIVMYGWSIGGYSAAWAAANYPIKGLILDATFDDLLPLAKRAMPWWWAVLVKEVVRSYVNLNVADLLRAYHGPLRIVRRLSDEVISHNNNLETNRGNNLLLEILRQRHPELAERSWADLVQYANIPAKKRAGLDALNGYEGESEVNKHVSMYMKDFNGTHCSPMLGYFFTLYMKDMFNRN